MEPDLERSTQQVTLRQLRGLLALAETQNFRRAAERLGVTQPSLSAQIQALEAALGPQLVERSRAGALMTPLGRDVATRARAIVDAVTALEDFTRGAAQSLGGSIRLGVSPTVGPYLLPNVVTELRSNHPDLKLYIREAPPHRLVEELSDGGHDVILTQLPVKSGDLTVEELFREKLYLVLARDHPMARQAEISASDLSGLEVLSLEPSYQLHAQVADLCAAFGARFASGYQGTSLDALRLMSGMGMGVTFLPQLYVASELNHDSEVVARRLRGRDVYRRIGLAWRKSLGDAVAYPRLADVIRSVYKSISEKMAEREAELASDVRPSLRGG